MGWSLIIHTEYRVEVSSTSEGKTLISCSPGQEGIEHILVQCADYLGNDMALALLVNKVIKEKAEEDE